MSTYAVILPAEKIKQFAEQLPVEYSASTVYINGIFFLMSNKSAFTLCKEGACPSFVIPCFISRLPGTFFLGAGLSVGFAAAVLSRSSHAHSF